MTTFIPWEIYSTRCAALLALGNASTRIAGDAEHQPVIPSYLTAEIQSGVLCLAYDWGTWGERVTELQGVLKSLPLVAGIDRSVLEFQDANQGVGTASLACIFSLYHSINRLQGRFALCGISRELKEFLRWHNGERIPLLEKE